MKNTSQFDPTTTNAAKGVALLLLLWHHLFYENPEYDPLVYRTAVLAKVCVAIFVILSGYGLAQSVRANPPGLFAFYKKRLSRLYFSFWFIAAIFIPIGIFFMGRTLGTVYKGQVVSKFILNLLGLHRYTYSELGYDGTWWYISLALALYLLFPFLYTLTKKYGLWFIAFAYLLLTIQTTANLPLNEWIFPFVLGIYFSKSNGFEKISSSLKKTGIFRFLILGLAVVLVAVLRHYGPQISYLVTKTRIDWLFGSLIILFIYELAQALSWLKTALAFLGNHLFNIFLFHSFIYYYYWADLIYAPQNPLLIFALLLVVTLLISMGIEKVKAWVGFYRLLGWVESGGVKDKIVLE